MTQPSQSNRDPIDGADTSNEIEYHFLKSSQFRVIKVDGAYGAVGPAGEIHAAVFNERWPLPVKTSHRFEPPYIKEEVGRITRTGIVREVEVDLVMTADAARKVAKWLNEQAEKADKMQAAQAEAKARIQSA